MNEQTTLQDDDAPIEADAPADDGAPDIDIDAAGGYSNETVQTTAYGKIMLLGPPKRGKTSAVLGTAPRPFIINCDGDSATKFVKVHHPKTKYNGIDVWLPRQGASTRQQWTNAINLATRLVNNDQVDTVLVDSVTMLFDNMHDELSLRFEGYEIWNQLESSILGGVKRLMDLQCHLFVIFHMARGAKEEEGIVPLIGGKMKEKFPGLLHDPVLFDYVQGRKPHERMFAIGPQGDWNYSGRNMNRSCAVPATVPALFKELGITL